MAGGAAGAPSLVREENYRLGRCTAASGLSSADLLWLHLNLNNHLKEVTFYASAAREVGATSSCPY